MTSVTPPERCFLVGGNATIAEQITKELGTTPELRLPAEVRDGDWIVLDSSSSEGLPFGNAFSACRSLKRDARVTVFLLVSDDDPFASEIARFCLADATLVVRGDRVTDPERIRTFQEAPRSAPSVEALLETLEQDVGVDRQERALRKMLSTDREESLLDKLTDAETGLFDGPFALFKLDEEFKRAMRFHQPLSLILLDCGPVDWPESDAARRAVLAEMASIFLTECRDIDILARFTANTFLFLLPGTGTEGASTAARRILDELRTREFSAPVDLTPAIGLATVPMTGIRDRKAFLGRTEECLDMARSGQGERGLCVLTSV